MPYTTNDIRPYTNIQPFTEHDAWTYLEQLAALRKMIEAADADIEEVVKNTTKIFNNMLTKLGSPPPIQIDLSQGNVDVVLDKHFPEGQDVWLVVHQGETGGNTITLPKGATGKFVIDPTPKSITLVKLVATGPDTWIVDEGVKNIRDAMGLLTRDVEDKVRQMGEDLNAAKGEMARDAEALRNEVTQKVDTAVSDLTQKLNELAGNTEQAREALKNAVTQTITAAYTDAIQIAKNELTEAIKTEGERVDLKRREMMVNVRDYGAVGDGVTDDAPAIKRAIEAGGKGAHIYFPKGVYLSRSQLKFLRSQRIEGAAATWGDRTDGSTLLFDIAHGEAVVLADANLVQSIRFEGPGATVGGVIGVTSTSYTTMRDCSFYHWDIATRFEQSWYTDITRCKWEFNNVALWVKYCYNFTVNTPHILANPDTTTGGAGIVLEDSTMMTVNGGSIESYATAVEVRDYCSYVSMGVYYESKKTYLAKTKVAVSMMGQKSHVMLIGSQVYVTGMEAFVKANDRLSGNECVAIGNKFKGGADTDDGVIYKTTDGNVGQFKLFAVGDSTAYMNYGRHVYRSSKPGKGSFVMDPSHFFPGKGRNATVFVDGYVLANDRGGLVNGAGTSFPPTSGDEVSGVTGLMYYRTDLQKLFLFNGAGWQEITLGNQV